MTEPQKIENLLKKGEVNVQGHTYRIQVVCESVELIPIGNGDIALSTTDPDDYGYTHGGEILRKAVEAAWEIETYLNEQRKKDADY